MDGNRLMILLLKILAVAGLVLLNGFFVAAEFALVKIRDTQLVTLAGRGHRRAAVARRIVHNLDAALSATQLGITIASLGLGWIGKPVFVVLLSPVMKMFRIESPQLEDSLAFVVGFSVITFLHIVAGELAPKSLAIRKPLPVSLWVALPLHWFYRATFPFIWLLNHAANWLLHQFNIEPVTEMELIHSEEELRLIVSAAQKESGRAPLGRDIVLNALDLRWRIARDVMRPRQEIVALDTKMNMTECLELAEKTRYSRLPLCDGGDLDKTLGVVHVKDLYAMRIKTRLAADLVAVAHRLIYVPETARLEKLLQLLLERRTHMAVVVDEYGVTVGLVTLENILEELVGQIQDEFDQEKPRLASVGEGIWEASGALPLHELEEIVGETLREEGIATASGWVTHRLGGFPKVGDVLPVGSYELRVEEMDGLRVAKLKLQKRGG